MTFTVSSPLAAGTYDVHIEGGDGSSDSTKIKDDDGHKGVRSDPAVCSPTLFFDQPGQGSAHPGDPDFKKGSTGSNPFVIK